MLKEISKAVDIFHRIAFGTKNNAQKLPEAKLAAFITALSELLKARYEKNWYPENPEKGSGYRCIRVNNQSIDPTIIESLKQAKIKYSKDLIITELTIWVDPGVVSVRIGEDGSIGSEVVDEEVHKISKEIQLKRSGLESDEGFSSRSSTPDNSFSDGSQSASSSKSPSPVPTKYTPAPVTPTTDFNRYSPPVQATYSSLYQRPTTPSVSQQPQRNRSPTTSHLQPVISQSRTVIPFGSTMISTPNRDLFSQPGYIPVSSTQPITTYSRPQALFSNQENTHPSGTYDGAGKVAFSPYHAMSMIYGGNFQSTNFYDIPAMA